MTDFIRRLEHTFNVTYGREGMSAETSDTLLHGQLQDGLLHELMKASTVSGAQSYKELGLATRNEEKRLAELRKRQLYSKSSVTTDRQAMKATENRAMAVMPTRRTNPERKYLLCRKPGHLAKDCQSQGAGTRGCSNIRKTKSSRSKWW